MTTTQIDPFFTEMPTPEQVQNLFNHFESEDKAAGEAAEYRMKNYFDCVDDYSWGGLCDQAADRSRNFRTSARSVLTEQLECGAFKKVFETAVLCDLEGNIVSERIVQGKYGSCWIIGTGNDVQFIGVAKKQATYNKKGYHVKTRAIEVEYYFLSKVGKKGLISKGRVLSNTVVDSMPDYQDTKLGSIAYFALQNQNENK